MGRVSKSLPVLRGIKIRPFPLQLSERCLRISSVPYKCMRCLFLTTCIVCVWLHLLKLDCSTNEKQRGEVSHHNEIPSRLAAVCGSLGNELLLQFDCRVQQRNVLEEKAIKPAPRKSRILRNRNSQVKSDELQANQGMKSTALGRNLQFQFTRSFENSTVFYTILSLSIQGMR